jgi:DNA-directed RNA polymerase subunit RPC12/RpoP
MMWEILLDILVFLVTGKKRDKDGGKKFDLGLEGPSPKLNPGAEIINLKKEYGPVRCSNCGKEMKAQAIRDLRAFWCPKCYESRVLKTGRPQDSTFQ